MGGINLEVLNLDLPILDIIPSTSIFLSKSYPELDN